jgi:Lipid A 3-O-deacylase (PagL)
MSVCPARFCLCLIALATLLLPLETTAQAPSNTLLGDEQLWDFGVWGAEAIGKEDTYGFGGTRVTMAGFHVGRVFHRASPDSGRRRTWEYTLDLQPLLLVSRPQRAYGGGFAPIGVKWNFAPRGRFRPYLEFNGGAMFTQKDVPPVNTSTFNFTAALGPGVMMAVSQTQAVSFALRWWHLSNGGIGEYNPSFNTIEFQIGYHWLIKRRTKSPQVSAVPAGTQAKE